MLHRGEIHALVGENGAGKSTLANVAFGALRADSGEIVRHGPVGLVHQHFQLAEPMRVWENVVLGREPRRGWRIDRRAAVDSVRALAQRHGFEIDPEAIVEELPIAMRQRIELLRELEREPAVLLLDEPTAALAPAESEALFTTLAGLATQGVAILIITHKLADVVAHAQRVTVMRAGKIVARLETAATTLDEIAHAMVGGELPAVAERAPTIPRPCLKINDLTTHDESFAARDVTLEVRSGEIVGIAGVEGNGQTALADAIAGVAPYDGTIELDGRVLSARDGVFARLAAGVRMVPQDRQAEALVLGWSIVENVALGDHRARLRRAIGYDRVVARSNADAVVARFDVRAASLDAHVGTLSGGNQQKIVVGRALQGRPRFVLAYQPTRGIDIGAAALVHSRLIEARNAGCAILLISFDLDEIFTLADRIAVMYRGTLSAPAARETVDRAQIGRLMAGGA